MILSIAIAWMIIGLIFFIATVVDNYGDLAGAPWWVWVMGLAATFVIYIVAWPWPVWHDYQIKQREEKDYDTM